MANEKEAKQGKVSSYLRGVKSEHKKIIWPDKETVAKYTGAVIFLSILVSLLVFALDLLFNMGITKLISL